MRKPREEGRSTRSSGTRPRATATQKKSSVPKVKSKVKTKPQSKKPGREVERPVQVTVIRVRNPKTTKNIIQGGVSKQKSQQKKKTSAVVGALKEDLLKKLAEKVDDKLSGVVNTLLEVAVVSKKVIPRKKNKDEEQLQSSPEKSVKKEISSIKQHVKSKKESLIEPKSEVTFVKENEKKSSKDTDKKSVSKESKKNVVKEDKKIKDEKKKAVPKITEKKIQKKTDKKNVSKESVKLMAKDTKKVTRSSKVSLSDNKKKIQGKAKVKSDDNSKQVKAEKHNSIEPPAKKDVESSKKDKDYDAHKKDSESHKKEIEDKKVSESCKKETVKKDIEYSKTTLESSKKDVDTSSKDEDVKKAKSLKDVDSKKSKMVKDEESKKVKFNKDEDSKKVKSIKDEDSKKAKSVKDEDHKKQKPVKEDEVKKPKNSKDDDSKNTKSIKVEEHNISKNAKDEENKSPKKIVKPVKIEKKKAIKSTPKKVNEKEKNKIPLKKVQKISTSGSSDKSREKLNKEEKKQPKKFVKRKSKAKLEEDKSAKISQILNTPKQQREASLNAMAKVHFLYENESRGAIMDIIDKSEKMFKEEKKEKIAVKTEKESTEEEEEEEKVVEEVPVRNLRTAPGLRSVGRHWEILNASSSSSEDSSDSASERKSVEEPPNSPPKVVEKKVKRRRKRSEVVMDLKDMVVKKRMASLNASAMMAATYSTDRRSNKSDDDSRRRDTDSRESSSTPEVVDVEETSDDEVILGGRKKAVVIVNQDTSDLTITGVYVNSTTRSTRHEGFCSIAGMQYRISSTSHTQTETAVSTETTVIHAEHGESSRTGGSDGGSSSCKTYTPLGALSSMQPPGSPRYPPSPASSAFSAPPHHHPHHQEMHGYFQPAGPLISSSQLKAGPSQVEEMQGTSSQAVTFTTYQPHPTGYLEPPGYPHAYAKYPPPPHTGYSPHRRYFYPTLEPYPSPYPHPHYYSPYTPPPQPPPPFRTTPYMDAQFPPCPCPMQQTCPKNVHTGPLTGTNKRSDSNSSVPPVGASRGPVQLTPVALALPPEPNTAVNPPSPARGSAGLPPPASPALAQASWGTPPLPQSPGLLTAVEPQQRRKRRHANSLSPPPSDHSNKLSEEPPDKLLRPVDKIAEATEKYERLQMTTMDRIISDRTQITDRHPPSETIIQSSHMCIAPLENFTQSKASPHSDTQLMQSSKLYMHDKTNDRLSHSSDKIQQLKDKSMQISEKPLPKCKSIHINEKNNDRYIHLSDKLIHNQTTRLPCPSDIVSQTNDRSVNVVDKSVQQVNRSNHAIDKAATVYKSNQHDRLSQSDKLSKPLDRISQTDKSNQQSREETLKLHPERTLISSDKTLPERILQSDRTVNVDQKISQDRVSSSSERLAVPDIDIRDSSTEDDACTKETTMDQRNDSCRKRSSSRESSEQSTKRSVSVNKRTSRPNKLPSPAVGDVPPKRVKSPETKVKNACVPVKNGRKKKTVLEMNQENFEVSLLINCPQLKWSNGWFWKGESFSASVYTRDDKTVIRKCYPAMEHREGDIIHPRDCILLKSAGSRKNLPFVAKVAALWENPEDGEMMVSLLWYYRPEHTEQGRQPHQPPDEVFASRHKDSNSVACIEDKCYVLTFNEYCRYMKRCRQMNLRSPGWTPVPESETSYPRSNRLPPGRVSRDLIFFCRKVYDFRHSRILKNPC